MIDGSRFTKSLRSPFQWLAAGGILLGLAAIGLAPMDWGKSHQMLIPRNTAMQVSRVIGLAMFQYANDHHGVYPTGKTSTQVFQTLLDGHYVNDPGLFWQESLNVAGKIEATSNVLQPKNVCWDITIPLDATSSDFLPVVFSTGYRINYVAGGKARPLFSSSEGRPPGIAVFYHGNNAAFLKNDGQPDGVVTNVISPNFDEAAKKYHQLTPDGTLPPEL